MRIGINASYLSLPLNGIGQVTRHLLDGLANLPPAESQTLEFNLYLQKEVEYRTPPNFQKRIVPPPGNPGSMKGKIWWECFSLPGAVRRDRCDCLVNLYQAATVAHRQCPQIMVVHDMISRAFPKYANTKLKRLHAYLMDRGIRRASRCVAVSKFTKDEIVKYVSIPPDRITVLYNSIDPVFAKQVTESELNAVLGKYRLQAGYIYHGGGLHERKNAAGVLEAYRQLLERNRTSSFVQPLPPLVISGRLLPGTLFVSDVEAMARRLGIQEHVVLVGEVSQADLAALYRGAAVFLYPSYYEGFGLPVLEAMQQGTPVITANTSSLSEVGGDAVWYCDPDKPAELASAVRNILTNAELRAKLSAAGKLRASTFSWQPFVTGLLQLARTSVAAVR